MRLSTGVRAGVTTGVGVVLVFGMSAGLQQT